MEITLQLLESLIESEDCPCPYLRYILFFNFDNPCNSMSYVVGDFCTNKKNISVQDKIFCQSKNDTLPLEGQYSCSYL